MNTEQLLTIHPQSIPAEGFELCGEIPPRDLDLPEEDRVSFADPISLHLHVGPLSGGILARGALRSILRCRCDRCLTYYSERFDIPECIHFYETTDNQPIDLTEDIREDILLSFPQHTVCRQDCRGLCPNCGRNLNVRDCGCRPQATSDAAWQELDRLRLDNADNRGSTSEDADASKGRT